MCRNNFLMMNNYLFATCTGEFNWNKLMRKSVHLVGYFSRAFLVGFTITICQKPDNKFQRRQRNFSVRQTDRQCVIKMLVFQINMVTADTICRHLDAAGVCYCECITPQPQEIYTAVNLMKMTPISSLYSGRFVPCESLRDIYTSG